MPRHPYEDPASSDRLAPLAARVTPELSAQQAAGAAEAGPGPSPAPVRMRTPQRGAEGGYASGTAGSWVEGFRQSPSLLAVQDAYSQELRRLVRFFYLLGDGKQRVAILPEKDAPSVYRKRAQYCRMFGPKPESDGKNDRKNIRIDAL